MVLLILENLPNMETPKEFVAKLFEQDTVPFNRDSLDEFTRAYLEATLWSSNDESNEQGGDPMDRNYSVEDISPECIQSSIADCNRFRQENARDLELAELADSRAGFCFSLSRARHGSGFFDEYSSSTEPGEPYEACQRLQDACRAFGEQNFYVGDDGKIYCM
jgi:hypothetical protein